MPELQEEGKWQSARLFPSAGIRGTEEQETRATAGLLSSMMAVPSFGHALLAPMNAHGGKLSTFTEVRLDDEDGVSHVPDGAFVIERGRNRWSALLEVKTGRSLLETEQIERYLRLARRYGFDGLLTISNQILADPADLPCRVNRKRIGQLTVRHISWWQVLTEAIIQHRFRGVDDPDQAWILGELVRYLTDERSGAGGFLGMGDSWVRARDGARTGVLQPGDNAARSITARWAQLLEYLCLNLSQELGVVVRAVNPRGKGSDERLHDATRKLADVGILGGTFRVPGAVGPIDLTADLKATQLTTSVSLRAPSEPKRPLSRIKWLLRQLGEEHQDLRIDVLFPNRRERSSALLRDCREQPERLLLGAEPRCQPRTFELALTRPLGARGRPSAAAFVKDAQSQATDFYRDVVQNLKPPPPSTPKLPDAEEPEPPSPPSAPSGESESRVRKEHGIGLQSIAELIRTAPESD
jgi:hypothetical protein